jgi:hypothetical protein
MSRRNNAAPRLIYEHVPCEDCEPNVDAAFDVLFDAVLKASPTLPRQQEPVENHAADELGGVQCKYQP